MSVYILKPKNTNPQISTIWAFVSVTDDGEAIMATIVDGIAMPLITENERNLPFLRSIAKQVAKLSSTSVRLIKLTSREVVEELTNDN